MFLRITDLGDLLERDILAAVRIHIDIQVAQVVDLLPAAGVITDHDGNRFVSLTKFRYGNSRQAGLQAGRQRRAVQSQSARLVLVDFQHRHRAFLKPVEHHAGHRRILGQRLPDFVCQFLYLFMLFADYPQHDRKSRWRPVGQHLGVQPHTGKCRGPLALHLVAQSVPRRRPIRQHDQLAVIISRHRTVLHQDKSRRGLRHIAGYVQDIRFLLQQIGDSFHFTVGRMNRRTGGQCQFNNQLRSGGWREKLFAHQCHAQQGQHKHADGRANHQPAVMQRFVQQNPETLDEF